MGDAHIGGGADNNIHKEDQVLYPEHLSRS